MGEKIVEMNNYGFTGKEISKKLDKKTIQRGGLETINMPVANCKVASELELVTVEVGGWKSYVNYNKDREIQFKKHHEKKSLRNIKKKVRSNKLRNRGLTYPTTNYSSSVIPAYVVGEINS